MPDNPPTSQPASPAQSPLLTPPEAAPVAAPATAAPAGGNADASQQVSKIAKLLHSLDELAVESGYSASPNSGNQHENQMIQARLGIAAGLFTALRCKHGPSAAHALRVALGCSSWAEVLQLDTAQRDALEVAALLHDIGKVGVPDKVLMKPGRLAPEEQQLMQGHRVAAIQILASCGVSKDVLEIVRYANAWYDGSQGSQDLRGQDLPLGARMLAIVDAFDSMVTDHVYRPAKSRERSVAELFECAGTQFDPELVRSFSQLFSHDQNLLTAKVARRWLLELQHSEAPVPWEVTSWENAADSDSGSAIRLFEEKLIDNMHDGVVFVDSQCTILLWNTGIERLTGVSGAAAAGRVLLPSLLTMRSAQQIHISDEACPLTESISTTVQKMQRVQIMGRQGHHVDVDMHVIPVRSSDGTMLGATVLFHDVSSEASLEEKCQALHDQVAKDPMTQVANRAEFDRMQALFIEAHMESGMPCSLIMCDIDHFKLVNDTFGHQAGDEAILAVASLLKSMCRSGDLVARYGGEEFAILCADCNNATAAQRAGQIRKKLSEQSFSYLGNKGVTASFGVTELQTGDTPETMLRRADRALLQAKDQGRNQVVQLGDGMTEQSKKKSWWPFSSMRGKALIETQLITNVPIEVSIQKLRGFIADQEAKITKTAENHICLELSDDNAGQNRRRGDKAVCFSVELVFSEQHVERSNAQGFAAGTYAQTTADVTIRPRRERDRFQDRTVDKARMILGSLKSYLMAKEPHEEAAEQEATTVATS